MWRLTKRNISPGARAVGAELGETSYVFERFLSSLMANFVVDILPYYQTD